MSEILVGIHKASHDKVDPELEVYRKILRYNKIEYIDLDSSDTEFWNKITEITHFIYKWSHGHNDFQIANAIIPVIQYQYGKKCFPNWETSWHYDDKIKQYFLLKSKNFPAVKSYIFYNRQKCLDYIRKTEYPIVFKLKNGSGSYNVKLVKSLHQAERLTKKIFSKGINQEKIGFFYRLSTFNYNFNKIYRYYAIKIRNKIKGKDMSAFWNKQKNYALFQDFYTNNEYDTRVQITGNRAFAFVRYNRPNDFRASGSNNWSLEHNKIDMEFVKIAFEVSKTFGFQSMAYDFIYDKERNPAIIEISYCYGDYPEFSTGYWNRNLDWVSGRFIPQYLELMDLLDNTELIQPDDLQVDSPYLKAKIN